MEFLQGMLYTFGISFVAMTILLGLARMTRAGFVEEFERESVEGAGGFERLVAKVERAFCGERELRRLERHRTVDPRDAIRERQSDDGALEFGHGGRLAKRSTARRRYDLAPARRPGRWRRCHNVPRSGSRCRASACSRPR